MAAAADLVSVEAAFPVGQVLVELRVVVAGSRL